MATTTVSRSVNIPVLGAILAALHGFGVSLAKARAALALYERTGPDGMQSAETRKAMLDLMK